MTTAKAAATLKTSDSNSWADLNGRWFFSWRMACACESALREVHLAMARQNDTSRLHAMEKASQLLRKELIRWVRRGEALDMIVQHVPKRTE